MKIPAEIKGVKRLRDLDICRLYIDGLKPEEIIAKRKLRVSLSAVRKVLENNRAFVNARIAWPKTTRIRRLQRLAADNEGRLGKGKGELEILEQLRKEVEGDKPLVDQSTHTHFTVILDGDQSKFNAEAERSLSAPNES